MNGKSGWRSYRKGDVNIIVYDDPDLYFRALCATEYCRAMNLKGKEARVDAFGIIRREVPRSEAENNMRIAAAQLFFQDMERRIEAGDWHLHEGIVHDSDEPIF